MALDRGGTRSAVTTNCVFEKLNLSELQLLFGKMEIRLLPHRIFNEDQMRKYLWRTRLRNWLIFTFNKIWM